MTSSEATGRKLSLASEKAMNRWKSRMWQEMSPDRRKIGAPKRRRCIYKATVAVYPERSGKKMIEE